MTNTNNPIELLVKISADTAGSKNDLNAQLRALSAQLDKLKLGITIDEQNIKSATSSVDKLGMKFEEVTLNTQKAERAQRDLERAASAAADKIGADWGKAGRKMLTSIEQVEKEFKGKDFTIKSNFDVKSGKNNLKSFQVDVKKTEDVIERVTYKLRDMGNGLVAFEPSSMQRIDKAAFDLSKNLNAATNRLSQLNQEGKISNATFNEMIEKANKIGSSAGFKQFENEIKKAVTSEKLLNEEIRQQILLEEKLSGSVSKRTMNMSRDDLAQTRAKNAALDAQYIKYEAINKNLEQQVFLQRITQEQANKFRGNISVQTPIAQLKEQETLIGRQVVLNQRNATELKSQVALQEKIRVLINKITAEQGRNPKGFGNNAEVNNMLTALRGIDSASKGAAASVKVISNGFDAMKVAATTAGRSSMGVMESFKIAMEKFPVWMAASTAFYGVIRTAKTFMEIIIDVDTKMTSLRKVMSDDTNFEAVFNKATASAERFGQSISEVMDSYVEFAKQGYMEDELEALANSAIIASNVGDITAQKASEYMTATLVQWKKESGEALSVIDSWNEISNNYSTTTEKLAQGHARSAAAAKAMGLEFDQVNAIIGTVTAATKQSGNEVGNFLKNVLPRLVGQPAQDALDSLDISLTDKDGNLRDIIQVYTEVANKVKDVSDSERIAVTEGLAGKFHISRMQALLDDLGSADSMYRSMEKSSKNSAGSAIEENEEYMKSLQARINLARVEVEKLALAFGEAFLTEGMIQAISAFGNFLESVTNLTEKVGALPIVLGTVSVALALISTRFRGLMTSVGGAASSFIKMGLAVKQSAPPVVAQSQIINVMSTSAIKASMSMDKMSASTIATSSASRLLASNAAFATASTRSLAASTAAAATASKIAASSFMASALAMKSMLISAGLIGVAFVAIGAITEKLMSKTERQRKLQETLAQENREISESYKRNKDAITELVDEHGKLEKAMKADNPSIETSKRYYEVQNELALLMPSLAKGEDSYGNKLIDNASVIESRIKLVERQVKAEQDLADAKKAAEDKENIKIAEEVVNSSAKDMENALKKFSREAGQGSWKWENFSYEKDIKSIEDIQKALEHFDNLKIEKKVTGLDLVEVETTIKELERLSNTYRASSIERESSLQFLSSHATSYAEKQINENKKMSDSSKELATNILYDATLMSNSLDGASSVASMFDDLDSNKVQEAMKNASESIASFVESSNDDFASQQVSLEAVGESLKEALLIGAKGLNGEKLKKESEEYKNIESSIDSYIQKLILQEKAARELSKTTGMSLEDARAGVFAYDEMGDSLSSTGDAADKLSEKMKALTSSISYINKILEDYSESNQLSTSTMMELIEKYPELISYIDDEAEMIKQLEIIRNNDIKTAKQQLANKLSDSEDFYKKNLVLIQQFVDEQFNFYKGDLKDWKNLAEAKLKVEEELIKSLAGQWGIYYDTASQMFEAPLSASKHSFYVPGMDAEEDRKAFENSKATDEMIKANAELIKFRDTWNDFTLDKVTLNFDKLGTSLDKTKKSTEKQTKAQKEANKAMEESTFIADKYKRALELLNLEIKKQQDIQSKFPDFSTQHIDAIQKEIKLQHDKMSLLKGQSVELEKQVKAGKILQTGVVTTAKGESGKSQSLSGWSGKITSQYGMRKHPVYGDMRMHDGIDIAGKNGTRVDANVSGVVTHAGSKGNGLGNYVAIKDASGNTSIYGHLEKVLVKAGQSIAQGVGLGTIGSTGTSTGNHLHYQVNDSSGKSINPATQVDAARKGISQASKDVAQVQSNVDSAQSELIGLNGQILEQDALIASLEVKSMDAQGSMFTHRKSMLDQQLENSNNRLKKLSETSQEYRDELENQSDILGRKQGYNQQEIDFYKKAIKEGGFSAITVANLTDKLHQLGLEKNSLKFEDDDTFQKQLDSSSKSFDDRRGRLSRELEFEQAKLEGLEEGSDRYFKTLEKIASLTERDIAVNKEELQVWNEAIESGKLYGDALADAKVKVEELRNSQMGLNNSLRENHKTLDESKIKSFSLATDESAKKIEFLNFQLSLLGEDDEKVKSSLFKEMDGAIQETIANLDSAIMKTVELRSEAMSAGRNTNHIDDELNSQLLERRGYLQQLQANYNNMVGTIKDAQNKIKEAEDNAYKEASDAFNKTMSDSEKRISKYSDMLDKLQGKLGLLQQSQFTEKKSTTERQLGTNSRKAEQIIEEFNSLRNTTAYSEEDADKLRDKLNSLQKELRDTNMQTIEYVKSLELLRFDEIVYGANLAYKEIDRLSNSLKNNLSIMEDGLLSGTELDFSTLLPSGNVLDFSTLIKDPIGDVENVEIKIQDIRDSSYGKQVKDAEDFHKNMENKLKKFQQVLVDEQEKYEKFVRELIKSSNRDKEKELDQHHSYEESRHREHIADLEKTMTSGLAVYKDEYSNQWDGILGVLDSKITEAKKKLNELMNIASNPVKSPSATTANKQLPLPKYAKGTPNQGHLGGLAVVGENGQELVALPNGQLKLTGDSGSELHDLPKGTGVLPNKETEEFLKKSGVPGYAKGISNELIEQIQNFPVNETLGRQYSNTYGINWYDLVDNYEYGNAPWVVGRDEDKNSIYEAFNPNKHNPNKGQYFLSHHEKDSYIQYLQEEMAKEENGDSGSGGSSNGSNSSGKETFDKTSNRNPLTYSQDFIDSYDPYGKKGIGSGYERSREPQIDDIKKLQESVKGSLKSGNNQEASKLTEQILAKQQKLAAEDYDFIIKSLTDLSEQREKQAKETRNELYEILKDETLSEEAINYYREEIQAQDQIINDSISERKKLIKDLFDYEQSLRDKEVQSYVDKQDDLQHEMALVYEKDTQKQIDLKTSMLGVEDEQLSTLNKQKATLKEQMKLVEVGSYEWNLLNNQVKQYDKLIESSIETQKRLNDEIIRDTFNQAQLARDERVKAIKEESDYLEHYLSMTKGFTPYDYSKTISTLKLLYTNSVTYSDELKKQQATLNEQLSSLKKGTLEWDLVNDKVKENEQLIMASLKAQQDARKNLLTEEFAKELKDIELVIFDGKTEEEARKELNKKYKLQDLYVDGLEKELEVEKLIAYARKAEVKLTEDELRLLNSKDKIEKKALERLRKQLEIRELEQRIANLNFEKNIQQLKKNEDGTWEYQYVVDQDAIDEAEELLRNKKLELIKFEEDEARNAEKEELDAKSDYFGDIKKIVDKALSGEITSFKAFSEELAHLNANFLATLKADSALSWNGMFDNMTSNIDSMKHSFRDYVSELQRLAIEAEDALLKAQFAKDKLEKEENDKEEDKTEGDNPSGDEYAGRVFTVDEIVHMSKEEKEKVTKSPGAFLMYRGKKVAMPDAMSMSDEELEEKYGRVYSEEEFIFLSMAEKTKAAKNPNNHIVIKGKEVLIEDIVSLSEKELEEKYGFKSGGYTGSFGSEGKLAFLHEKELVLNQDDTKNMLNALNVTRDLGNLFDANKLKGTLNLNNKGTEQSFHIADIVFPNVTSSTEIQDAFKNLPHAAMARVRMN